VDPVSEVKGKKNDESKPMLSLYPVKALAATCDVMVHGGEKYGLNNWRHVEPPARYLDAALRHLYAVAQGELVDPDSGLPHLAHASASVAFLLERQLEGAIGISHASAAMFAHARAQVKPSLEGLSRPAVAECAGWPEPTDEINVPELVEAHQFWLVNPTEGERLDMGHREHEGLCFSGYTITGAYFSGAIMPSTSFARCGLMRADFTDSDLRRSNFEYCLLNCSNFKCAILRGANFTEAHLTDVDFTRADLTGADFTNAQGLDSANFNRAKTDGATWPEGFTPEGVKS